MKPIFNLKNPRHMQILREELKRAKQILIEGYSADEIWQSMPDNDRNTVLYVAKATNPEELIKMSWDAIPADVQDLIDLSDYELARDNKDGRTNLRGISSLMSRDERSKKFINKFLYKIKRNSMNDITVKQSYQLSSALNNYLNSGTPSAGESSDDSGKANYLDMLRKQSNSGLD
jgi:hypothetical protein